MMNNTGILVQIIGAVVDADFSQAETLPALLNALEVAGKKIGDVRVVVNGAGAAAVSCSRMYITLGVKPDNLVMCDSKGVIRRDRPAWTA